MRRRRNLPGRVHTVLGHGVGGDGLIGEAVFVVERHFPCFRGAAEDGVVREEFEVVDVDWLTGGFIIDVKVLLQLDDGDEFGVRTVDGLVSIVSAPHQEQDDTDDQE